MRPEKTIYRLAQTPQDYARCKQMWAEHPDIGPVRNPGWPTIMATRDGKLLGFISTNTEKNAIVVSPLCIDGVERPGIISLRLVEKYDAILKQAGVSAYYFAVSKIRKPYLKILKKLGLKPYNRTKTDCWFKREI